METTTTPRSQMSVAFRYAIICTMISIVFSLLLFVIHQETNSSLAWFNYLFLIAIMFLGIKDYRNNDLNGYITFGKAFSTGILIAFFGSIIFSLYNYIFITLIDPHFMADMMDKQTQIMIAKGMSQDQIDRGMKFAKMFSSPFIAIFFGIIGYTFFGLIISLLEALILKKDNPEMPQA